MPTDQEDELLELDAPEDSLTELLYGDLPNSTFADLTIAEVVTVTTTAPETIQSKKPAAPVDDTWRDYRIPKTKRTVISPIFFAPPETSPKTKRPRKDIKRLGKPRKPVSAPTHTVTSQQVEKPATATRAYVPARSVFDRLGDALPPQRRTNTPERRAKKPETRGGNRRERRAALQPKRRSSVEVQIPSDTVRQRWRKAENKLHGKCDWLAKYDPRALKDAPRPGVRGQVDTRAFSIAFNKKIQKTIDDLVAPTRDKYGFPQPLKLQLAPPELAPFVPPQSFAPPRPTETVDINPTWGEADAVTYSEHCRRRRGLERAQRSATENRGPVRETPRSPPSNRAQLKQGYTNTTRVPTRPTRPGGNRRPEDNQRPGPAKRGRK